MSPHRHEVPDTALALKRLPFYALREALHGGYPRADLRADAMAGVVVGVVALPLSMALAIAVGAPPQHGLYTAIVAGLVVALLGGSRTQVTGPTAAFIVILAPICTKFGIGGLLVSGFLGGLMLLLFGLLRMGRLIEFIPHPVTTGFTAGIATVIATLQIKDLLGLRPLGRAEHFVERIAAMVDARATVVLDEVAVGLGTLALLVLLPRLSRRVPAPLVALPLAAVVAALLSQFVSGFEVATIASRFQTTIGGAVVHGIPQLPPLPMWPWDAAGPGGQPFVLSLGLVRELLPGAFAIAMLGAIESLLSAVVADSMAGTRHNPDAELIAQGVGNMLCPFFGGIPATGALARTATNIRSGGRSPVSAIVHALTVLGAVLVLAPLIGYLPMASLAALLLVVAWNMSEIPHFVHIVKVAPKSDVAVLLACFGLTVVFDMVIAVTVGVVLAALLFMRRMAVVTHTSIVTDVHPSQPGGLPDAVVVCNIAGPLFFGAAHRAMNALEAIADRAQVVVLRMDGVPVMDATGLVALESALSHLQKRNVYAILCNVQPQPQGVLDKAHIGNRPGHLALVPDIGAAVAAAQTVLAERQSLAASTRRRTGRISAIMPAVK